MVRNKKGLLFLSLISLGLFGFLFSYFLIYSNPVLQTQTIISEPQSPILSFGPYHTVCTTVTRGKGSEYGPEGTYDNGCTHNNITFIGRNITRNMLGAFGGGTSGSGRGNFTFIALCGNSSSGVMSGCNQGANQGGIDIGFNNGSGSQSIEYISNGLARQAGNWSVTNGGLLDASGNWSISATFTSSGVSGLQVNGTGLFNSTISSERNGTMLAVNKFNQVSLDGTAGDTLTVTWIGGIG